MLNKIIEYLGLWALLFVAAFVGVFIHAQADAQETVAPGQIISGPSLPGGTDWIAKVAEAIKAGAAVALTAEEVQALGQAYAALEQRQVADIAFSETHIYVVSPAGTVVLSKEFPR